MPKRPSFSKTIRDFITLRAKGCCEYCKTLHDFSPDTFEIEHIVPLFLGGINDLINLAFSCSGCNGRKSIKISATDPISGLIVHLYNPRMDKWDENFEWKENFSIVNGITPQGRATVELLQLNRFGVVNLRKALVAYGVHPVEKN